MANKMHNIKLTNACVYNRFTSPNTFIAIHVCVCLQCVHTHAHKRIYMCGHVHVWTCTCVHRNLSSNGVILPLYWVGSSSIYIPPSPLPLLTLRLAMSSLFSSSSCLLDCSSIVSCNPEEAISMKLSQPCTYVFICVSVGGEIEHGQHVYTFYGELYTHSTVVNYSRSYGLITHMWH